MVRHPPPSESSPYLHFTATFWIHGWWRVRALATCVSTLHAHGPGVFCEAFYSSAICLATGSAEETGWPSCGHHLRVFFLYIFFILCNKSLCALLTSQYSDVKQQKQEHEQPAVARVASSAFGARKEQRLIWATAP